ncbi:MAG: hypothetical protein KKG04_04960 [Candidatus Thermoplasmatota archaeon]|nr:hypothetical protein [Candidatus Thermoplasmatota archaeon]
MQKIYNFKKAAILLTAAFLILSTPAAIAKTIEKETIPEISIEDQATGTSNSQIRGVIYDNGMGDLIGMLAAQDERPLGGTLDAFPADDFILNKPALIQDVHWQGGYYNCQYAQGAMDYKFDWNISFYADNGTGTGPGVLIVEYHFPNASIDVEFWYNTTNPQTGRITWYANYSVQLPDPLEMNAGVKYWVSIYGIGLTFPQSGWCRHNESVLGIKFNQAVFKSIHFGFPDWTTTTVLVGEPNDFNFVLTGEEIAAPELNVDITGGLGLTATITNSGSVDATNVEAKFAITGGFILLPPGGIKTVSVGTISKDGGTSTAKCMVFGIGKPTITVDVICDEGVTGGALFEPKLVFLFLVL